MKMIKLKKVNKNRKLFHLQIGVNFYYNQIQIKILNKIQNLIYYHLNNLQNLYHSIVNS
jgi:hypothetical protein